MTSQCWSRVVSVLVFGLVLATAGSARAQWGFPGVSVPASVSPFGVGYGTDAAYGLSPSITARSQRQASRARATSSASRPPAMPGASGEGLSRPRRLSRSPMQ